MKTLLDQQAINRAITRISHEIIEKNKGVENVVIMGVKTRGIPLAERIAKKIGEIENQEVGLGHVDIAFYRDDLKKKSEKPIVGEQSQMEVANKVVIIVDDVVFTGRTCRAAIDVILDMGRPKKIQFAVLIDRGHRELPLRPDYVGKNVPTSAEEVVRVKMVEIDGEDRVIIQ